MATEETTITELELAEEVLADMVIPVDTSTDTKSVSLKQLRAWLGSSLPTGFILPAVGKINDERFSLLDGKTLSKQGTYGAFCAKVEEQVQASNWFACTEEEYNADLLAYGQCGKFVIGTDYVRIPTITRFIGATITLSEIGKTYKESLPNITGSASWGANGVVGVAFGNQKAYSNATGALSLRNTGSNYGGIGATGIDTVGATEININASSSSSTYKNGAKVQPDHTKYPYYMVISTEGQTANIEIDINKVYEDMNLKANTSLSNVAANIDFVVESYNNGTNWYRVYKSGWIEQGGTMTGNGQTRTTTFLKSFKNTNYTLFCQNHQNSTTAWSNRFGYNKTTTGFSWMSDNNVVMDWCACGQKA